MGVFKVYGRERLSDCLTSRALGRNIRNVLNDGDSARTKGTGATILKNGHVVSS
ncbi:hypothetical protein [Blastomonas sp. RAC04]|uniref:hypothetical protein n=1 Tax=Blastomonas sp. RAC04 TaxID=1842535 RepID=UPI001495F0AB|nr:hypothetical protein [Blastomonas sp. RAC04]